MRCPHSFVAGSLLTVLVGPASALAQDVAAQDQAATAITLEEITVTSRRRAESLSDVPVAIDALSAATIEERNISSVNSVAALTPGLEFDKGASPADMRPSLRGISLIEGRSNVAIIVDGLDVTGVTLNTIIGGGGSQTAAALMDLERIEVVKGPQSVYFGRSAFAGAIQFVSRDPEFTPGGKVSLGVGDYGRSEATVHVTGGLTESIAGKFSAMYNQFDGFYENPGNGRHLGGNETKGFAGALLFEGDALRVKTQVSYIDENIDPGAGYVMERPDTTPFGLNRIGEDEFDKSQVGISSNIRYAGNQSETVRAILDASLELTDTLSIQSLTGLNKVDSWIQFDFDTKMVNEPTGTVLPGDMLNCLPGDCVGIFDFDTDLQQISQELRLTYDGGTVRGLIGGYFFDEEYQEVDFTRFVGAQPWVTGTRSNIPGRLSAQDTRTYSAFGSVEVDVTDALTLSGELRYSHETIESRAATDYNILLQTGSTDINFRGRESFDSWLPRFSARYSINDDVNVYASAAKGTKPGGFNLGQVRTDLRPFGQEKIWTYEVGTKASLLDRRMSLEAAVYYSDWQDVQVTTICYGTASPFGPEAECPTATAVSLNYIINADKATVKGAEFAVQALATDDLTLGLRYAYTDSEFKDFLARDVFPAPASPDNRQFAGNTMPLVAKHSVSADVRYEHDIADATVFTELSGRYRSSRYARFDNRVKIDDKTVVDARIGMKYEGWTALFYVDNVFDDRTPDFTRYYGNFSPSRPNGEYIVAPAKRAFGLRVSKEF
jgi:iron complex outermembrane receptor protein